MVFKGKLRKHFFKILIYLRNIAFTYKKYRRAEKLDYFTGLENFVTRVFDYIEKRSIFKIFSSLSGVRMAVSLSPQLSILCISSVKTLLHDNNSSPLASPGRFLVLSRTGVY